MALQVSTTPPTERTANVEVIDTPDDLLANGVLFNEDTKILLAEKFINVEFFVPFPTFNLSLHPSFYNVTKDLSKFWSTKSVFCDLDFSTNFQSNDSSFTVDWLLRQVERETEVAHVELESLHEETHNFLRTPDATGRTKRGAPIAALAVGAIGLFGGGVLIGNQGGCGLTGIFGSCQDRAKENAENIVRLADFVEELTIDVHRFRTDANEKFYMVSKELGALHKVQQEMIEIQNQNWAIIEEQFQVFADNIHILRNCDQILFSRQQVNFNYDSVSSLLSLAFANIKAYRSALYAYRMNLMTAIPTLLKRRLPMSLVSKDSLLKILDEVAREQSYSADRLSLAIPFDQILSYYEAELLLDVLTLPEGLFMTLSIPLASKQTALTVYRAYPIPMPHPEPEVALKWSLEAEYLAISEDRMETAPISQAQLEKCIGSTAYQICHENIATEMGYSSCLATLFFQGTLEALKVCETHKIFLPAREQAYNLGYGVWLILSAHDSYTLTESDLLATTASDMTKYKGCRICVVTLSCGRQLVGPNVKIRSDLASCKDVPPIKIQVRLPDPLAHLISQLPSLDELPMYTTQVDASVDMLRSVRETLVQTQYNPNLSDLEQLAKPIAAHMRELKPSLIRRFDSYSSFKHTLLMSFVSFFISTLLHVLFFYLYHRFSGLRKLIPTALRIPHDKKDASHNFKPMVAYSGAPPTLKPSQKEKVFLFDEGEFRTLMATASAAPDDPLPVSSAPYLQQVYPSPFAPK